MIRMENIYSCVDSIIVLIYLITCDYMYLITYDLCGQDSLFLSQFNSCTHVLNHM